MFFFLQAEDGIRYLVRSRGLGDVYKRQAEALTGLKEARLKLFNIRARRMPPGLDDKVLTAWNGLMPVSYTHLTLPTSDLV